MIYNARLLTDFLSDKLRIWLEIVFSAESDPPIQVFQRLASRGIISEVPHWNLSAVISSLGMIKKSWLLFPDGESNGLSTKEYRDLRKHAIACLREIGYKKKLNSIKLPKSPAEDSGSRMSLSDRADLNQVLRQAALQQSQTLRLRMADQAPAAVETEQWQIVTPRSPRRRRHE